MPARNTGSSVSISPVPGSVSSIPYHADNKAHPHFKSKARSVLFAPSDITLLPEGLVLDTKSKVYLVNFSIQGSMTSPLNGDTFPTVDPQVPVTVVCSFSQKDCLLLCPQEDDVFVDVKQGQLPPPELASSIEVLRKTIWDRLSQADYVLTAPFPQMARDAGVSDYHLYADLSGELCQTVPSRFQSAEKHRF